MKQNDAESIKTEHDPLKIRLILQKDGIFSWMKGENPRVSAWQAGRKVILFHQILLCIQNSGNHSRGVAHKEEGPFRLERSFHCMKKTSARGADGGNCAIKSY